MSSRSPLRYSSYRHSISLQSLFTLSSLYPFKMYLPVDCNTTPSKQQPNDHLLPDILIMTSSWSVYCNKRLPVVCTVEELRYAEVAQTLHRNLTLLWKKTSELSRGLQQNHKHIQDQINEIHKLEVKLQTLKSTDFFPSVFDLQIWLVISGFVPGSVSLPWFKVQLCVCFVLFVLLCVLGFRWTLTSNSERAKDRASRPLTMCLIMRRSNRCRTKWPDSTFNSQNQKY